MTKIFTRRQALTLSSGFLVTGCIEKSSISDKFSGVSEASATGAWQESIPLPFPVQEIYPCVHNGAIYLAGGFVAANGRITGPANAYHHWTPGSRNWTEGPALPLARHHPQLVSFQNKVLAIAGFESVSADALWVMQSTGWQFPIDIICGLATRIGGPSMPCEEPGWQPTPELPAPCGEAVTGVTGDGVLHLAGGRTPNGEANASWNDHTDTDHHFVLATLNGQWETAAPCPSKRNSAAGDVIDGNLHIVGGRTVEGGNVSTHEIYDHREDRWRSAAPMPQAQGGLAAAAVNGKLYAFGGEYFDNGGGVYPESWVYNPATDAWSSLPDMPNPRHGLGAVALDGNIYVVGGALQAGGNQTSAIVDVFTPA